MDRTCVQLCVLRIGASSSTGCGMVVICYDWCGCLSGEDWALTLGGFGHVVGRLYSVQYKSIFGVPDKVRCDTCDKARPLSQVSGVQPNTSLGYEVAEPPHHHQIIIGMQDCIPTWVFGTGQTEHVRSNGHLHGPLFPRPGEILSF
jgi:hypothetical protein